MALSDRRHHDVAVEERFLHAHGDHATHPSPTASFANLAEAPGK